MATGVKKKARTRRHVCVQSQRLDVMDKKLHDVYVYITGNGTPEEGILFQLAKVKDGQDGVKKSVDEMIGKYQESIDAANAAKSAVSRFRAEDKSYKAGEKDAVEADKAARELKHAKVIRILTFITVLIAAIALGLNTYFNFKGKKVPEKVDVIESKVDDLGAPVVVNPRGEAVNLPKGYELKMFPKDFDTIKKDTI